MLRKCNPERRIFIFNDRNVSDISNNNQKSKVSEQECHSHHKLVKSCICVDWSVPNGETQTIYQMEGIKQIFASGFIQFDCGNSEFVNARFFLENKQIGETIKVFEDSSFAFNFTKFDRITVECPSFTGTSDPDCPDACEGELCIVIRHQVG